MAVFIIKTYKLINIISYDDFKKCSNEYRSAPFCSWNDKLNKEELIHQIHEMNKQGMGDFFMHLLFAYRGASNPRFILLQT